MPRAWTAEQRLAIDTRDKSLLLSAAAGSGKTATLTQRIIESLLDEDDPADISEMLIVTFTRAAVGELRERIGTAIKERLAEQSGNARLEKQLMLLPSAKILTIDAFCNDCLKTFPEEAGIDPVYRIADEAEMLLISREIYDGLTESILRGELSEIVKAEDFELLSDCLVDSKKMADTFDVFRTVYEKLRTTRDGIETLAQMVEEYSPEKFTSVDNTVFGKYILSRESDEFKLRADIFSDFSKRLAEDSESVGNYREIAEYESLDFTRVAKTTTYSEMRQAVLNLQFSRLATPSKLKKTKLMLEFSNTRDKEKRLISEETQKFFSYSEEDWKTSFKTLYPILTAFLKIIRLFDSALNDRKKQLCTFDYTDIERLTFDALVKDGKPGELAKSIASEYRYIYIDEYQDVNDLQDAIFRAVSRENNRFTVGDIKQSIYGFRCANPKIFAEAKRAYPKIGSSQDSPALSLFMSKNFRSSGGIIDFINTVFDKMFEAFSEGIDYSPGDRLEAGRAPLGNSYFDSPEICVCTQSEIDLLCAESEEDNSSASVQPAVVAAKIKEILDTGRREDGSPVHPSDIAVILRSMKDKAEKYTSAIESLGVPVKTTGKKNFFMNADVLLALCLLNSINNPLRDVYLTGLLRSPIFAFTADELVKIRGSEKHKPFYYSLCEYTSEHPEFSKGKAFLGKLNRWRQIAEGIGTDKLLVKLFRETGLLALASESGEKENLIRLYEYARSFEGSPFGGLGSFISYINNVIAEGGKFDCNISSDEDDAVTVISAHSSKGLEYPIVFLADASRVIKNRDSYDKFLFAPGFAVATRHRTPLGLAIVDNPMISATAAKMTEESFEEELRILYVALTRAREKLFIIGSDTAKSIEEYKEELAVLKRTASGSSGAKRLSSFLDIICTSSELEPMSIADFIRSSDIARSIKAKEDKEHVTLSCSDASSEFSKEKINTGTDLVEFSDNIILAQKKEKTDSCDELTKVFSERFKYKYHSLALTRLPEKMSVSALYPTVLDGTDQTISDAFSKKELNTEKKTVPEFIKPNKQEQSKLCGIATHLFLQFCDLEKLEKFGTQAELDRLVGSSFISEEDAARVRISEIEAFLKSELFERMRSAKSLWREFRFNTPLPALLFTEEKEKAEEYQGKDILVQGVIDCIIEAPDGSLSVIDYKTDRLSKNELCSPDLSEKRMRREYEDQLYYYCLATERIFGRAPVSAEIFSLHLGSLIDVKKKDT